MKSIAMARKVDSLGRITVPKEIRRTFGIEEGDLLEIYTGNDKIILLKYVPAYACIFCGNEATAEHKGKKVCNDCIQGIQNQLREENGNV